MVKIDAPAKVLDIRNASGRIRSKFIPVFAFQSVARVTYKISPRRKVIRFLKLIGIKWSPLT
jgi:hypothetical protein